jgi:hypothetical protein
LIEGDVLHLMTHLALSAELSLHWQPTGLPDGASLGQTGLVSADFDGDGELDLFSEYVTTDTPAQGGFVGHLSSTDQDYVFPTGDEVFGFRMDALDVSGDGVPELIVWQEGLDDGDWFALDLGFVLGGDIEDSLQLYLPGDGGQGSGFSTSWAAADLSGDGRLEIVVTEASSPGATFVFQVPALPAELEPRSRSTAAWYGLGTGSGVIALQDVDGNGAPDLALTSCQLDAEGSGCAKAGLVLVLGEDWQRGEQELTTLTVTSEASEPPQQPFGWPDVDLDEVDEVVWPLTDQLLFVSPMVGDLSALDVPGRLHQLRAGDADHDGLEDLWVLEDAGLSLYNDPLGAGALEQIAPFGGQLLARLGDVDDDGCHEVLVSVPAEAAVYRVDSDCIVDSQADSDSPEDSTPDSEPPNESRPPDTSDSGPGPVVCEPEYGWGCGSATAGTAATLLVLMGLSLLRREPRSQA